MLSYRNAVSRPVTQPAQQPYTPLRRSYQARTSQSGAQAGVLSQAAPTTGMLLQQRAPCRSKQALVARSSSLIPATSDDDIVRVAAVGDVVSLHFTLKDANGEVLESSREEGEPLTFEVGAGDSISNPLFQGFDEAVRGLAVGQGAVLEATGEEWQRDLLFAVPRDHPEMQRLEGRYKSQGGLVPGSLVELSNGGMALVLEVGPEMVKLDANSMIAGKTFTIELVVESIEKEVPPAQ